MHGPKVSLFFRRVWELNVKTLDEIRCSARSGRGVLPQLGVIFILLVILIKIKQGYCVFRLCANRTT
jgi:hypothetical protein